ncbi:MAG: chromosome partitioning protein, ParB family [Chloroflexi bacterium]|nr:MAG: chromosome partitioning protein, ParB family [Chloroflexota bacterium]
MTTARPALGRGLDALFERAQEPRDSPGPLRVPIDRIDPNPEQPRSVVEPQALEELAASVRAVGILQPLLVTAAANDRYTLVAGERRWRAARLAGLSEVPVIVTSLAGDELLTAALVENVQREDLSPLEEARAYERLIATTGESQSRIAERVGKSRSAVANALRLLGLPEPIRDSLARGEITEGHARALLGAASPDAREQLWRRVIDQGLNVRQTERAARPPPVSTPTVSTPSRSASAAPDTALRPSAADDDVLARELERALGTRVRLRRAAQGGTLEVRWYDDAQLQQIATRLAIGLVEPPLTPPDHLTI